HHLTVVPPSTRHAGNPGFTGRVNRPPPVVDLTANGFLLLGGRLDYIDGQTVASIVYRRRQHVINLFVAEGAPSETREPRFQSLQGFNIQRWTARGLEFFAVSDLNAEELREFADKFEGELHPAGRTLSPLRRGRDRGRG